MEKDFLDIADLTTDEVWSLFESAKDLKAKQKRGEPHEYLKGKTLGMVFTKPSTRTRVSFEVGMFQLGGHALYFSPQEIGLGKRESVPDVARVLSRYVDGIMARLFGHEDIVALAEHASVPVINGLTDLLHPCQILGDMLTILESRPSLSNQLKERREGKFDNLIVTFIGDGNNVARSLLLSAAMLGARITMATPPGYEPPGDLLEAAAGYAHRSGGGVQIVRAPEEAAAGADVVYTDVWTSMGQDSERLRRQRDFAGYQVSLDLMRHAAPHAVIMHDLPAHRGEEILDEAIESPQAVVFDQAENRLHAQRALLALLLADV